MTAVRRAGRALATLLIAAGGAAFPAAHATSVYRCGADGRTFSQLPCADGHGVPVPLRGDGVDAEREAQARAVAAREGTTADLLAQQRRALARQAVRGPAVIPFDRPGAVPGGVSGDASGKTPTRPAGKPSRRTRPSDGRDNDFRAVSPAGTATQAR